MAIQVYNIKASQALRGEAVLVTLSASESAQLENFSKGMLVTHDETGRTGTIHRVDYRGHSFLVSPIQPDREFGIYGYLAANDGVTIDNS